MRPAWVLLDRDGTINAAPPPDSYVTSPRQLELLHGAAEAIARVNRKRMPVVVVTNQRAVALGRMSPNDLDAVHARLEALLARSGAHVDLILACPHDVGQCGCRKPLPGLLQEAASRLALPLENAVMIGDSETDVEAGASAGTQTVRIAAVGVLSSADKVARSLADAVTTVLGDG